MAKKFQFSLKKVLDYRKNIEDEKAVELKKQKSELRQRQQKLTHIRNKKMNFLDGEKEQAEGRTRPYSYLISFGYKTQLNKRIDNKEEEVKKSKSKVQKRRSKLIKASKKRKILENLEEQRFEEYKEEYNQEEKKRLDEIAIRRASNEINEGLIQ